MELIDPETGDFKFTEGFAEQFDVAERQRNMRHSDYGIGCVVAGAAELGVKGAIGHRDSPRCFPQNSLPKRQTSGQGYPPSHAPGMDSGVVWEQVARAKASSTITLRELKSWPS